MIILQTQSLRDFAERTKYISRNNLIPILSNLHLRNKDGLWLLTKNNLAATCEFRVEAEGDPATILLDERILMGFLQTTKAATFKITHDTNITLDDGVTQIQFQAEDPANFPLPNIEDVGELRVLHKDILDAIGIARNFLYETEAGGNFRYVHVNGSYISGFHNNYFYVNNQFKDLPLFLLSKEEADIVSALGVVEYGSTETKNYFFTPGCTYVFAKTEYRPPKLETVLERLQAQGKDFTFKREELLDFINVANIVTENPVAGCAMTPQGPFMMLKLTDANFARGTDRQVAVTGTFDEFNFNSRLLAAPLRAVPYEILLAKTNQNCLIITGNNEYFCFIGMQK